MKNDFCVTIYHEVVYVCFSVFKSGFYGNLLRNNYYTFLLFSEKCYVSIFVEIQGQKNKMRGYPSFSLWIPITL